MAHSHPLKQSSTYSSPGNFQLQLFHFGGFLFGTSELVAVCFVRKSEVVFKYDNQTFYVWLSYLKTTSDFPRWHLIFSSSREKHQKWLDIWRTFCLGGSWAILQKQGISFSSSCCPRLGQHENEISSHCIIVSSLLQLTDLPTSCTEHKYFSRPGKVVCFERMAKFEVFDKQAVFGVHNFLSLIYQRSQQGSILRFAGLQRTLNKVSNLVRFPKMQIMYIKPRVPRIYRPLNPMARGLIYLYLAPAQFSLCFSSSSSSTPIVRN